MRKIRTIIDKEWAEVFKNGVVLGTVILLPVILTLLPLVILYVLRASSGGDNIDAVVSEMPPQFAQVCGDLQGMRCTQVFIINQFMMLFMMMPLIIPAAIAAYSIVGEKTTRCLEPLLATPITTMELIVGKAASAAVPAIAATWGGFLIFAVGAWLIIGDPAVARHVVDPQWLIAVILVGPLMAIAAVSVSIMISSRVSDPRAAEQISTLVLLPVLAIFLGQLAGLLLLNVSFILWVALALAVIDVILVYVAVGLFQREVILTKWK